STTASADTSSFSVIAIPRNIDFVLSSKINKAHFMDFTLSNASGDIIIKDGVANLNGLRFNMLGGAFVMDGSYNTRDIANSAYDMCVKIQHLSMQQAANAFSIVKTFAPVAGIANGHFSTDFKIDGKLLQNMMPNMRTVNGSGLIKIAQASLKDSK